MAAGQMTELALLLYAENSKLKQGLKDSQKEVAKFNKSSDNLAKSSNKSFSQMSKTAGGAMSQISGSLGSFAPAAQGAVGGFQAMAVGARTLNVALGPIGLIIGAVALAVKALSSYFKGSVDGGKKLASIMGNLNGVMTVIQDAFIALGRLIVKAFEDPKQAIADLWEAIKNNIWNRWQGMIKFFQSSFEFLNNGFTALGKAIAGVFDESKRKEAKKYWDDAKKNLLEMGDAALQVNTGLDKAQRNKLVDKLEKGLKKVKTVSEDARKIEEEAFQLQLDRIAYREKAASIETEIAELIRISSDKEGTTAEERAKAIEEAGKLRSQLGAEEISLAEKELDIQERKNNLGESGIEDLEKRVALVEAVEAAEKKVSDQLRAIENRNEEIQNQLRANAAVIEKAELERYNKISKASDNYSEHFKSNAAEMAAEAKNIQASLAGAPPEFFDVEATKAQLAEIDALIKQTQADRLTYVDKENESIVIKLGDYTKTLNDLETSRVAHSAKLEKQKNDLILAENQKTYAAIEERAAIAGEIIGGITTGLGNLFEAQKNKELKAAGDNAAKREQIEKKFAKKQKAISIVQALVNTSLAVTKALSSSSPPKSFILAGITAAAGAAQVAAISSASFAEGGIVSGPVNALVGEYPGARTNPEVIAPLDKLQNIIGGGSGTVTFEIEYDKLIGVLDNGGKIINSY